VEALVLRLDRGRLRVVVIGEAKRGKSSLINTLLGRQVLPTGVVPVTTLITELVHAETEAVDVTLADGTTRRYALDDLPDLVTERANPSNRLGVASVVVRLDDPLLATGVELVDTPGTGSVLPHNTVSAQQAREAMDVAVLVLTADAPMSAAERELLIAADRMSVRVLCVLNKVDYLDPASRQDALDFVGTQVAEALGGTAPIIACSTKDPSDPGLRSLRELLGSGADPEDELSASLAISASRICEAALDSTAVTEATLTAADRSTQRQLERFRARLAEAHPRRGRIGDLAEGLRQSLLRELDDEAARTIVRLQATVDATVTQRFRGDLAALPSSRLEDAARDAVAHVLAPLIEEWRAHGRRLMEEGLVSISEQLTRHLQADIHDLRDAARDLIGVELGMSVPSVPLPVHASFVTLSLEPGQTELTARAVRRHLPGSLGRRRIEARVRADSRRLTDAQVGRVRADLQASLVDASRELARSCASEYAETLDRLEGAIAGAEQVRAGTQGELVDALADLRRRSAVLTSVRRQLRDLVYDGASRSGR
jgi:small GTP-binding protein